MGARAGAALTAGPQIAAVLSAAYAGRVPRLMERLAALDRRVLGPIDARLNEDGYDNLENWWRVVQPKAKAVALSGYAAACLLAAGIPWLLFGWEANKAELVVVGVSYWPLVWHVYMRKRFRPEFRRPANSSDSDGTSNPK